MAENPTSVEVSERPKQGFSFSRFLLNMLWWSLIIGLVMGLCGGAVFFTEKVLGIESFWGAVLAFPIMGIAVFVTLAFASDVDTGWTLGLALTIGGFIFWLILRFFGFAGIGLIFVGLVLLCSFLINLTDPKEREEIVKDAAEDLAKEAKENKTKFETKLAPLSGKKITWKTTGKATTLYRADTTEAATLKLTEDGSYAIEFFDGSRYLVNNSTLQFSFKETTTDKVVLTYHRSIFSSEETIELESGRRLELKRHQSNLLLERAMLAWEMHEGKTALLRLEEKNGGGGITLAGHLSENKDSFLLSMAGIFAIQSFWANVAAAGSTES